MLTQRLFPNVSELQGRVDGVAAMPHRLDASTRPHESLRVSRGSHGHVATAPFPHRRGARRARGTGHRRAYLSRPGLPLGRRHVSTGLWRHGVFSTVPTTRRRAPRLVRTLRPWTSRPTGPCSWSALADLDLAFILAEDGSALPDRKGRNGEWATSTVPLAWVQGRPRQSLPHLGPRRSINLRGVFGIESVRGREPVRRHRLTPLPVHGEVWFRHRIRPRPGHRGGRVLWGGWFRERRSHGRLPPRVEGRV